LAGISLGEFPAGCDGFPGHRGGLCRQAEPVETDTEVGYCVSQSGTVAAGV